MWLYLSAVKDLTGLMFNKLYVIGRDFEKEKISKSRDSQFWGSSKS